MTNTNDTEDGGGLRPAIRLLVLGASGTGTSTLARGLASVLATQSFDTDDFFWVPTDPPYRKVRPVAERLRLAEEMFLPRRDWILGGSAMGWSIPVVARLTHVVFLTLDPVLRQERLKQRELQRYGNALPEAGEIAEQYESFMKWAAGYDDPDFSGRNIQKHRDWLATLDVPVLELDTAVDPQDLIGAAIDGLDLAAGHA